MTKKKKSTAKKVAKNKTAPAIKTASSKKKTVAKKPSPKKAAKKADAKAAEKKATPAKKAKPDKLSATKATVNEKPSAEDEAAKKIVLSKRTRKATPAIFKIKSRKATPIVFTLEDVRGIIEKRKNEAKTTAEPVAKPAQKTAKKAVKKVVVAPVELEKAAPSVHAAASTMDILGFNPKKQTTTQVDESKIPSKWMRYYKSLVQMREELAQGLDLHTKETLHRSSKDDSGDLPSYSNHMADSGTENFDRDFALSVVSSEQEALQEIEAAIQRILDGTYGVCGITGKPIKKERLLAVPFTRHSLEGQRELEGTQRKKSNRSEMFAGFGGDEPVQISDDDS